MSPVERAAPEPQVELVCPVCGGAFRRYASQVRWRGARYCSRRCQLIGKAPKKRGCQRCGAAFVPKNPGQADAKFCSRACYFAAQAADRSRRVVTACQACGAAVDLPKAWARRGGGRYCSKACQAAGRVRPESESSRGAGWRRRAAEIRERDGGRCVRCGGVDEGRDLAVDHIVPWVLVKSAPEIANDPANLASLCLACHGRKTTVVEPRLMRGDWVALARFYGAERADVAMRNWARKVAP